MFVAKRARNILVYLRDGIAWTTINAATLKLKPQIRLGLSPSQSTLTTGQPVLSMTLKRQTPDRVATTVSLFQTTGMTPYHSCFKPLV